MRLDLIGQSMTAAELRTILVGMLASRAGGDPERWDATLGEIQILRLSTGRRSNWSVMANGSESENAAIDEAADILRGQQPYVSA